jgi:hypothetical protein
MTTLGDRWYMREPESVRGMTLTTRRFGVDPGAEPTAKDELEGWVAPDSRWLTVAALVAHHTARLEAGVLVRLERIPGGVRTRRTIRGFAGYAEIDIVEEETLS